MLSRTAPGVLKRLRYILFGALAASVLTATTALAGSGVGGVFNLGQTNTVNGTSTLKGTSAGSQLRVENASTGTGAFSVYGLLSSPTPGASSTAVRGVNNGTGINGYGVWGTQVGQGVGVYGTAVSGTAIGVSGKHTASTGTGPGVRGETPSPAGAGVLGVNTGSGPGLQAQVTSSSVPPLKVNSDAKVANLNADKLDGSDSSAFAQYKRTIIVSPVGSATQNGTALKNALAAITTASATNPFLLKIEPGIYQVSTRLDMKPNVDIEGSGEGVTTIQGLYSSSDPELAAVVKTAASSELRGLTVQNLGQTTNNTFNVAVYDGNAGTLRQVTAVTSTNNTGQTAYGTYVDSSTSLTLDRITSRGQGAVVNAGVDVGGASPASLTIQDSTLTSGAGGNGAANFFFGLRDQSSTSSNFTIERSQLSGASDALETIASGSVAGSILEGAGGTVDETNALGVVKVGLSQLAGGPTSGTVTCAGVYDENYTFSANTCP